MPDEPDLSELSAAVTRVSETYAKKLQNLGRRSEAPIVSGGGESGVAADDRAASSDNDVSSR